MIAVHKVSGLYKVDPGNKNKPRVYTVQSVGVYSLNLFQVGVNFFFDPATKKWSPDVPTKDVEWHNYYLTLYTP